MVMVGIVTLTSTKVPFPELYWLEIRMKRELARNLPDLNLVEDYEQVGVLRRVETESNCSMHKSRPEGMSML